MDRHDAAMDGNCEGDRTFAVGLAASSGSITKVQILLDVGDFIRRTEDRSSHSGTVACRTDIGVRQTDAKPQFDPRFRTASILATY